MKRKENPIRVFIVEDDPVYVKLVKYVMEMNPSFEISIFATGKECIANLYLKPSIISLDYSLPDMNGAEILKKIIQFDQEINVIILSGQKDISIAVQLLQKGAIDYIEKGEDIKQRLLNTMSRIKQNIKLKKEVESLKEALGEKYSSNKELIGNSKVMQSVFKILNKAIRTSITVSIAGETGTGKEVIAKTIHYDSSRKSGPFIPVNVTAIPRELLESELFGYEKGAFTGANTQKIGKFELADKGTLFLDEIAEMDMSLQSKLLRALQEREITRIGGNKTIKFDIRLIVATHKNLADEVEKGNFREDLYYRLLGLPILLPPLRARGHDILLLTKNFLIDACERNRLPKLSLTSAAKEKLLSYAYPGNVRELKAIIELAAVMAENEQIEAEDIQFNSPKKTAAFLSKEQSLKDYTQKIIYHFLEKYNNDVLFVAKKLDIGKSTIYRILKENK
ncbi:MAG: sigma-54-dependent transcriptional regulator [Saprospiraceae bacterium]